jgi:hypothetical protein
MNLSNEIGVPQTLAVVLNPASGLELTAVIGRFEAIRRKGTLDCFVPRNDECPVRSRRLQRTSDRLSEVSRKNLSLRVNIAIGLNYCFFAGFIRLALTMFE